VGDLAVTLRRLAARLAGGRPVVCTVTSEGPAIALPAHVEGHLFRIAQEAITNTIKHADARRIEVRITYEEKRVKLTVIDDGLGFDPTATEANKGGHFGLLGMRERAQQVGTFELSSAPGAGTRIAVTVDG